MEPSEAAAELINYKGLEHIPRWVSFRRFVRAAEVVALIALGAITGVLGSAYEWFWMNTLGQTYTSWVQENP